MTDPDARQFFSLLYDREKQRIEKAHEGDPAYCDTHESPARLRRREEEEREADNWGRW